MSISSPLLMPTQDKDMFTKMHHKSEAFEKDMDMFT